MMETIIIDFEGVPFTVPLIGGHPMEFSYGTFEGYPSKCGAGSGIGDLIVPEKLFGLLASPVCDIHDQSWEVADPTSAEFKQSNAMFFNNLITLILYKSTNRFLRHLRCHVAVTAYSTVSFAGSKIFWKLKDKQGMI